MKEKAKTLFECQIFGGTFPGSQAWKCPILPLSTPVVPRYIDRFLLKYCFPWLISMPVVPRY